MNILVLVDDNYIGYCSAMLESLLTNNKKEAVTVFIIRNDMPSDKGLKVLDGVVRRFPEGELKPHQIDKDMLGLFKDFNLREWPVETYFRIFAPWILDEDTQRILYLDSDIIVNRELSGFFHTDMGGKLIAACRDTSIRTFENRLRFNAKEQDRRELEKIISDMVGDPESEYINSGVLLMDLKGIREKYRYEEITDFIYSVNDYLMYPDQDIINLFFADDILHVDPMLYNCQIGTVNYREEQNVLNNACIMHFTGGRPWNRDYRKHYSSAVRGEVWWKYAVRSGARTVSDYRRWKAANLILTKPWMILYDIRERLKLWTQKK